MRATGVHPHTTGKPMSVDHTSLPAMDNYQGPATLHAADGTQYAVTANLRTDTSGRLKSWRGTITPTADADRIPLLNVDQGTLRMPDGREGAFIASYTAVAARGTMTAQVRITGSGPAPF